MDDSWKNGLITAQELRDSTALASPEAIALVKDILEEAKKVSEAGNNSFVYYVNDSKKFNLVTKVVTMLCSLGYDTSMIKSKVVGREGNYREIHVSW
jgi:hypothetical protein